MPQPLAKEVVTVPLPATPLDPPPSAQHPPLSDQPPLSGQVSAADIIADAAADVANASEKGSDTAVETITGVAAVAVAIASPRAVKQMTLSAATVAAAEAVTEAIVSARKRRFSLSAVAEPSKKPKVADTRSHERHSLKAGSYGLSAAAEQSGAIDQAATKAFSLRDEAAACVQVQASASLQPPKFGSAAANSLQSAFKSQADGPMLVKNPRASDRPQTGRVMLSWRWGEQSSVAAECGVVAYISRTQHIGSKWPQGATLLCCVGVPHDVLCCIGLSHAVLCYVELSHAVLCFAVLCCAVLTWLGLHCSGAVGQQSHCVHRADPYNTFPAGSDVETATLRPQLRVSQLAFKGCLSCSKAWQPQQAATALQQYWDGSLIIFSMPAGQDSRSARGCTACSGAVHV